MKKSDFVFIKTADKVISLFDTVERWGDKILRRGHTYTVAAKMNSKNGKPLLQLKETGKWHYADKFKKI